MADETFGEFVARERDRLHREREAVFTQQQELEAKLRELNQELSAIDAYESAKSGRSVALATHRRPTAARGRRGSKREQLLDLMRQHPEGLERKDILERLGLKGDKPGEMSVSNALTALTKASQLIRAEKRYRLP